MTDIFREAKEVMLPEDITHFGSHLYLRKNKLSARLIRQFDQRGCVREVLDQIDGDAWYVIWYAYPSPCEA